MGMKKLLTALHHGRQAAVQAPSCRGNLGEKQGKAEEVGGGCWCFLDAEVNMLLFDAEVDMLLTGTGTDMLLL